MGSMYKNIILSHCMPTQKKSVEISQLMESVSWRVVLEFLYTEAMQGVTINY